MPRVLSNGVIVSGLGVVPLDADRDIAQANYGGENWRVSIRQRDGNWQPIPGITRGCSAIAASDGFWLADLRAADGGVFGADGVLHPEWALPASQDGRGYSGNGAIAVSTPDAEGLFLHTAQGISLSIANARVFSDRGVAVVSPSQVLWVDWDGTLRQVGLPGLPQTLPGAHLGGIQVFRLGDEWWVSYFHSDAVGIVLHPFSSFDGYVIAQTPAFFCHGTTLLVSPRLLHFAWGKDSAENSVGLLTVSLNDPRRNLLALVQPSPAPLPPQPPQPQPTPMDVPDRLQSLKDIRAAYPERITANQAADILNRFCWQNLALGFRLWDKDGGNTGVIPGTSIDISVDILVHLPTAQYADVFGQGPDSQTGETGPAIPQWGWQPGDMSKALLPVKPVDVPPQPPEPPPPQPPAHDLQQQIDDLRRALLAVSQESDRAIVSLQQQIDTLEERPVGISQRELDARLKRLVVKGSTSRSYAHGHDVNLQVTEQA